MRLRAALAFLDGGIERRLFSEIDEILRPRFLDRQAIEAAQCRLHDAKIDALKESEG